MSVVDVEGRGTWGVTAGNALRRLAAVTWAGGVLGLLVGGVGGRLAMMLLARLNPGATGVISDDGFVMGRLSLETLDLLMTTTLLGVLGGGIYLALRGLMLGPRWFQVVSVALGPAVVVGSLLVHVDGVDFTLEPTWLAIVMFVAIPGVYAAFLTVLSERWVRAGSRFMTANVWLTLVPLLLWTPIAPLLGVLVLGWVVVEGVRRTRGGEVVLGHPGWPWLARGALAVVFTLSLVDLVQDAVTLV